MDVQFRSLTEQFARTAREFSDAVARLGRYKDVEPEQLLGPLEEVKLRHRLCAEAEESLELSLRRNGHRAKVDQAGT